MVTGCPVTGTGWCWVRIFHHSNTNGPTYEGLTKSRAVDDASHRLVVLAKTNVHGELAVAVDELLFGHTVVVAVVVMQIMTTTKGQFVLVRTISCGD